MDLIPSYAWWYNWHYEPRHTYPKAMEYVPMIWGRDSVKDIGAIPANTKYLLGFNEPNIILQSNMTAAEACSLWPQLEATGKILGSPAVNHCHAEPSGHCVMSPEEWLKEFFSACPNAKVDFIAAHYYGCTPSAVTDFVTELSTTFKKPVWLTETACPNHDEAANLKYMKELLPALEKLPKTVLARYVWYAQRTDQTKGPGNGRNANTTLIRPNTTQLSSLGEYYLGL
jgi:hypothetical protein